MRCADAGSDGHTDRNGGADLRGWCLVEAQTLKLFHGDAPICRDHRPSSTEACVRECECTTAQPWV